MTLHFPADTRGTHLVALSVTMTLPSSASALLVGSLLLLACSGKTAGAGSADGGGDSGKDCVDIAGYFQSGCATASDCITITTGQLCTGGCACGNSAVSATEEAHYQSLLSSSGIELGECGCPEEPVPQCLGGMCTICRGTASDPPACGTAVVDAGSDGQVCVNVDLSTYDTSCQTSSDCADITSGILCTGSCACGGSAINSAGLARYQSAVASLGSATACPCPAEGVVACVDSKCTVCGFGPNQPAGCPDGF
jgi:hypothetical protein